MDVDFWSSSVNSTKNISAVQSTYLINSDSQLNVDNEGGEDVRTWFPCPFCYVEIEVPMLCCHLQDEHCFDLKNAVCPICAASLGKDPIVHFSVQHAQSVKRRRKYLKSGYRDNATAMIGKDLQDIASYFETNSGVGRYKGHEPAPDPLLLPFLCNVPPTHTESRRQDKSSVCDTATTEIERKLLVSDPALEEDFEEKRQRAAFLQELIASTIF
ncbi:protein DEHYDRATION-INDUCED 19 homolog 5 isoform X2 [Nicotiana tabacum]|uniref:Protein DEHYDRATION-INDUCED 19 homolog 5 isoform X2 n=1 Tax=Nicotiana tabacum TaxID=4097 RepID=A0A1S4DCU1_TOBAC|nr:protein DEHYDRATION-INDUCED 19 homolog 5-like isoform X2 [Nicotiana tomentosiformis]XP_016511158.1 PREDICTED: protein DEHYDRATION-INDUCED 19 homolog 5-like isoform X2 [Nicotiana tabacum]